MTDDLKPNAPDCMQRGYRTIAPGIYKCSEGHRHLVAPEICRTLGVPMTQANLVRIAAAIQERWPDDILEILP